MATPPFHINPETGAIEPIFFSPPGEEFSAAPAPPVPATPPPVPMLPTAPAGFSPPVPPPGASPETTVAEVGPDVTRVVASKDFKAARAAVGDSEQRMEEAAVAQTDLNIDKAGAVVKDDVSALADRQKMEGEAADQKIRLGVVKQELVAKAKQLRDAHAKDYERDFMTELGKQKGAVAEFGAALAIGVGAFAASMNHTPNFAMDVLKDKMDRFASAEKGRLLRQKEEIERAGHDVSEANQEIRDFDTITRPQMESALMSRAIERRKAILNQYGAQQAQIDGDELIAKMQNHAAQNDVAVESGLNAKVDNSAQNAAKRAAAGVGGKPTEANDKAVVTINQAIGQIQKVGKETQEYTGKDRALILKWSAIAREAPTTDPEKFAQFMSKMGGAGYIAQLSENGRKRFNLTSSAIQDTERNLSGGSIQPHEMAATLELSTEKGGIRHVVDRIKRFAPMAGPRQKEALAMFDASGLAGSDAAPSAAPVDKTAIRAEAASLLRKRPEDEALKWLIANPGNPKAGAVLERARSQ